MARSPCATSGLGDRVRDLYDLAVVKAFAQVGKPIFGVCRGLQLINVAFGGALYQDIETQHPGAHCSTATPPPTTSTSTTSRSCPDSHLAKLYPNACHVPGSTASTTRASSGWRRNLWSRH